MHGVQLGRETKCSGWFVADEDQGRWMIVRHADSSDAQTNGRDSGGQGEINARKWRCDEKSTDTHRSTK